MVPPKHDYRFVGASFGKPLFEGLTGLASWEFVGWIEPAHVKQ